MAMPMPVPRAHAPAHYACARVKRGRRMPIASAQAVKRYCLLTGGDSLRRIGAGVGDCRSASFRIEFEIRQGMMTESGVLFLENTTSWSEGGL